ncbi:hypothetical protein D9M69_575290 [compost metagenome]
MLLAAQLVLKVGHLADGVLVEQGLEALFVLRQAVLLEAVEHGPVIAGGGHAGIHFAGFQGIGVTVVAHRLGDFLAQAFELLVLGVDTRL